MKKKNNRTVEGFRRIHEPIKLLRQIEVTQVQWELVDDCGMKWLETEIWHDGACIATSAVCTDNWVTTSGPLEVRCD
jgi:hypothetical protein